jgi:hypothetical protein
VSCKSTTGEKINENPGVEVDAQRVDVEAGEKSDFAKSDVPSPPAMAAPALVSASRFLGFRFSVSAKKKKKR